MSHLNKNTFLDIPVSENHPPSSGVPESTMPVKEETAGANDDTLLFSDDMMTELQRQAHNFQLDAFTNIDNAQMLLSGESMVRHPLMTLNQVNFENFKPEDILNNFVKYKLIDGKHVKFYQCTICSKEFYHQYTLARHLPTHTDERKFQCNVCGKAFRQMSTLSQHRAIHSTERPYICETCHKTFNRISTLISHRKTHTENKPHQCHLCNKAFHQKGNLRNHIFTHTNERPYKCDVCNKGFNQMSNLMCHKMKAHQRSDKPRYICQTCGKEFLKRIALRNHEQYEHGQGSSGMRLDPMTCTSGVLIAPIQTAAMQHAISTSQTPFALLRPLSGIPVLVRVLQAGSQQMLVPATAEDLRKHGQITINPSKQDKSTASQENWNGEKAELISDTPEGSTVRIKVPVVATVIQKSSEEGNVSMSIQSPGPKDENTMDSHYFYTTMAASSDFPAVDNNVSFIPTEELNSSTTTDETDLRVQQSAEVVEIVDQSQSSSFDTSEGIITPCGIDVSTESSNLEV